MTHNLPPAWASDTQREIVAAANAALESGEAEIEAAQDLESLRAIKKRFVDVLDTTLFSGPYDLDARVVSRHSYDGFEIENVLFRSSVGWQINGTVFRPPGGEALPGVVCPTGSSTKLNYPYWSSAQLLARSGYVVLSYDPPGFIGERRERSDMFRYAPLGYLTGVLPRGFFVADTMAAIDYLESRPDVDDCVGFGVTGLSLGAQTTANVAVHDSRIRFIAPVCGIMSNFEYLLSELYTVSCVDMVPGIMQAGMDASRRLSIVAPLPCLLVTGAGDEICTPDATRRVYNRTRPIYRLHGAEERFELFIDPEVGHTYSPKMVNQVLLRLDEYLKGRPREPGTYRYTQSDVVEIPREHMEAHPDTSINVSSLNAAKAEELRTKAETRRGGGGEKTASGSAGPAGVLSRLLGIEPTVGRTSHLRRTESAVRSWVHDFTRVRVEVDRIAVPGLVVARAGAHGVPGMVFVDEEGCWAGITGHGYLARAFRFLERDEHPSEPTVLSIDASGFGSRSHRASAYDATSWADPDSTLAYLGIAAGTPVSGLRVRDTLLALHALESLAWIDPSRLIVGGLGDGAIAALCAAVIHGGCARTILVDPPLGFTEIVRAGDHAWRRSSFIPRILEHFDLVDLFPHTGGDVRVVRPLDAARIPAADAAAVEVYGEGAAPGGADAVPRVSVVAGALDLAERDDAFVEAVLAPWNRTT